MSEVLDEAPVEAPVEAAVDAPVEAPVAPVTPAYDPYEDPRVAELVDQRAAVIAEQQFQAAIERARAEAQQPATQVPASFVDEFGNFDADGFAQFMAQQSQQQLQAIEERINALAQPLQARESAEREVEGRARLNDILADNISRHGDFPADPETGKSTAKEQIPNVASALFPSFASRLGGRQDQNGDWQFANPAAAPRAAEQAMEYAASLFRANATEAVAAARIADTNRIATLAGARPELAASGIAGIETMSDKPLSARELSTKYGQKAQALRQTPAA